MKIIVFLTLIFLVGEFAHAGQALDNDFNSLSRTMTSGELQNSFCYAKAVDSNRIEVEGVNKSAPVRLASISKIVTSFWALSTLGPHFQFETTLTWNPKTRHLHIAGSQDPFMGQQSLMFLASELDRLAIHDVDLMTFDSHFLVYEFVDIRSSYESTVGAQMNPSTQDSQTALLKYLNTRNWSASLKSIYAQLRTKSRLSNLGMVAAPKLSVRNVILNEENELRYDVGTIHLTYTSEELYKYLKHMNTNSINYPANIFFRNLGGTDQLAKFLGRKMRMRGDDVKMYTGSGLEFYTDGEITRRNRVDNESTCENILKVTQALDNELKVYGLSLSDVLLVSGVDQGTWAGSPAVTGAITAKTGTLVEIPVVNLAGMASTQAGNYYFGMFFQLRDRQEMNRAHAAEISLADRIVETNGGRNTIPLAIDSQSFLPYASGLK